MSRFHFGFQECTPLKFNIDTQNGQVYKGVTISKPSFGVSILVDLGVCVCVLVLCVCVSNRQVGTWYTKSKLFAGNHQTSIYLNCLMLGFQEQANLKDLKSHACKLRDCYLADAFVRDLLGSCC